MCYLRKTFKKDQKLKNMKHLLIIIVSAWFITACQQNSKDYEITGTLENAQEGMLLLKQMNLNELEVIDSTTIDPNGAFVFTGTIESPNFFLIEKDRSNYLTLIVHPGDRVQITANAEDMVNNYTVSGSEDSRLLQEFTGRMMTAIEELTEMGKIYRDSIDSPSLPAMIEEFDQRSEEIGNELRDYTIAFINDNSESLVSMIALYQQLAPRQYILDPMADFEYYARVDSILYAMYPESDPVRTLHEHVADLHERKQMESYRASFLGVGSRPPEISLPDPSGDTLRLSDTRGKIVLLDFWAAWCPPCREESPNLVENYNKYHDQGFEIFQVSLDRTKEAWLAGIEEDNLQQWLHVSDLQYWNSSVVAQYNLESIPASYLLDRDGKIIASNLRGSQLGEKLKEIFE